MSNVQDVAIISTLMVGSSKIENDTSTKGSSDIATSQGVVVSTQGVMDRKRKRKSDNQYEVEELYPDINI
ncbi:hypothetical protein HDV02_006432 [Globomyces sp. JEL0801]|nr:hypothetical protein HDV02_006432 [Globomyces sp. JEL0801]